MAFLKSPNDDDVRKICSIRFNLAENKNKNIMDNEKIVDVLNDLLQITNDRIKGFSKVEDKVWEKYSSLKGDYDHMVSESQQMKTELHELIRNKGGEPDDSGTVLGSIHRGWIDVKNALVGDKAESTLENVVFGEKAAIEAYESALSSGVLCSQCTPTVQKQLQSLRSSYAKFENLEELHD